MSKPPPKEESKADLIIALVCTVGIMLAMACMVYLFVATP